MNIAGAISLRGVMLQTYLSHRTIAPYLKCREYLLLERRRIARDKIEVLSAKVVSVSDE